MANILPIASGKGGVGKSSAAVNLAVCLARRGRRVVLADLDFGGANLHTLLGLKNNHAGLGNFIYKQTADFADLLQDTGVENLTFIAGDCLYPGTANIDTLTKKKVARRISELDADDVLLDLGAGTTYNTLDFYLLTRNSIIVTTPELTSILNAYSFLKAAAFRYFMRQFKTHSAERKFIDKFLRESASGTEASFLDLLAKTAERFSDSDTVHRSIEELGRFRPQVLVNMGQGLDDLEMAKRLRSLVHKKLGITMDFVGFLPRSERLSVAVATRTPLAISEPDSPFVRAVDAASGRILEHTYELNELQDGGGEMFDDDFAEETSDDLDRLSAEFTGGA